MGGYVTRYRSPDNPNGTLDFVTVRGAGHMVPQYKPRETYTMLDKFLFNNGDLPVYTPPVNPTYRSKLEEREDL